jgi:hypothetical protein
MKNKENEHMVPRYLENRLALNLILGGFSGGGKIKNMR